MVTNFFNNLYKIIKLNLHKLENNLKIKQHKKKYN